MNIFLLLSEEVKDLEVRVRLAEFLIILKKFQSSIKAKSLKNN